MKQLLGFKDLLFDAVDETTRIVEDTHRSVREKTARRVALLPGAEGPARAVTAVEGFTAAGVYASIRGVNRAIARLTDAAAAVLPEGEARTPLSASAAGSLPWLVDQAQGALNGIFGDSFAARSHRLALDMSLRVDGERLALEREALREAYPHATGKLAIFVHGLSLTEWSWSLYADEYWDDPRANFGTKLAEEQGYTPLYVRYNTGLHISENGRSLSELIEALLAVYPVPVEEIVLVGHSMGGLVSRSAAHYGAQAAARWAGALAHVFCIGSPHHGAPLEKATNALSVVLRAIDTPGTRVPARLLDARSAGIKDLRFGYLTDEEWIGKDPDTFLQDNSREVPLIDGVGYYFVGATITRDPLHPLGQLIGDTMVRLPSVAGHAPGSARHVPFHFGRIFPGMHHFHIVSHPDVYDVLSHWCRLGHTRRRLGPPTVLATGESVEASAVAEPTTEAAPVEATAAER